MHRQTTPHPQQRRNPVRRTFSQPLFVYLWREPHEKGALPLLPLFFRPRWEEEEEGLVEACCCDPGTTGETLPRSAEEGRRFPRNLRGMQRLLNKRVVRSCAHLGQGRIQQRSRKNSRRRGTVSITQSVRSLQPGL